MTHFNPHLLVHANSFEITEFWSKNNYWIILLSLFCDESTFGKKLRTM